jgi:hypothetical protein
MTPELTRVSAATAERPSLPSRIVQAFAVSLLLFVYASTTACGLQSSEYTIRADRIADTLTTSRDSVSVRVTGFVANDGCGRLERVEKRVRRDTLLRRFVGETNTTNGTNCTQMPIPLDYRELVYAPAGSTVVYAVQQPDGTLLVHLLAPRSAAVGAGDSPVR